MMIPRCSGTSAQATGAQDAGGHPNHRAGEARPARGVARTRMRARTKPPASRRLTARGDAADASDSQTLSSRRRRSERRVCGAYLVGTCCAQPRWRSQSARCSARSELRLATIYRRFSSSSGRTCTSTRSYCICSQLASAQAMRVILRALTRTRMGLRR